MKLLSSMVFAGAVALAVVPVLAVNFSGALANTGFNSATGGTGFFGSGKNMVFTGPATAGSSVTVMNVNQKSSPTGLNASVAVANTGFNSASGKGTNLVGTGPATAGSSVTVMNFSSSFNKGH